jgi:hypothetical protein
MLAGLTTLIGIAAVIALGLSAGAMLAEAKPMVDSWRAMPAAEFLAWFAQNEPRLVAFFAPLQTTTTLLSLLAAGLFAWRRRPGAGLFAAATALCTAALLTYALYFRDANATFATQTIPVEHVAAALAHWSTWQWARTSIGISAFVCGLLALTRRR